MKVLSIETSTHGRALVREASRSASPSRLLVGFHGYGQSAEDMLEELGRIPGNEEWTLVSIQALHRFYAKGEKIVASWMTRQDRELAIADNIGYVNRVMNGLLSDGRDVSFVFVGFSQGVAMAYRAAVLGTHRCAGIIAVAGDVPPDVKPVSVHRFPPIFIAAGDSDAFYTPAKVNADEEFLRSRSLDAEVFRYSGGHEWTVELRDRIHVVLDQMIRDRRA